MATILTMRMGPTRTQMRLAAFDRTPRRVFYKKPGSNVIQFTEAGAALIYR